MFICSRDENKQTQEKLGGIVDSFDKVGYFINKLQLFEITVSCTEFTFQVLHTRNKNKLYFRLKISIIIMHSYSTCTIVLEITPWRSIFQSTNNA